MVYLELFGTPSIKGDDAIPARATQRHRVALLALLALAPGRRLSRDKLIGYLWPERDAEGARNLLKVSAYVLRGSLGEDVLLSEGDDLRLNSELIQSDIAEFDTALEQRDYARAVTLYKGPLLDGFFLSDAPEFESWTDRERTRLATAYRNALEALAVAADEQHDFQKAVEWWKIRAAQDPYDSAVALRLMQAFAAAGNRAGALQHASVHERMLQTEFGVSLPNEIVAYLDELRKEPVAHVATSTTEPISSPPTSPALPVSEPVTLKAAPRRKPRFAIAAVGLLLIVSVGTVWTLREDDAPGVAKPGIAVLPFQNVGAPDEEYFAAGMTDEITSRLGAVSSVGVVPGRATERYTRTDKTVREIGRELGVDYVLTGSVRWADPAKKHVRVTLELLRARDERQLWSTIYDRVINDIFDVQSDIAEQVIRRVGVTLVPGERRRINATRAENYEAYTLYLKGRYFWNKRTEADIQRALNYFQQAVDLDPGYAVAWSGIADVWIFRGWYSRFAPRESFPKAKEAALRALQFDSTLAEAHASLAHVHFEFDHDWPAAEREYKRAIQLDPRYAVAHHWYGGFLSAMGRHEEALQQAQLARSLDPIAPIIQTWVGLRYYFAHNYDKAIAEYDKALELVPGFAPAHWHRGWAYEQTGRFTEGIEEAQLALKSDPQNLLYVASLAHAYAKAGETKKARETLAKLLEASARAHVSAYQTAVIYIALGDNKSGLTWLERAFDEQSAWIGYLKVDPRVDAVRGDPRFEKLLAKARL